MSFLRTCVLPLLLAMSLGTAGVAQQVVTTPGDPVKIPSGGAARIDVHGTCRVLNNWWDVPVAIPNQLSAEWNAANEVSFLSAGRENVGVYGCNAPDTYSCPSTGEATPYGHATTLVTMILDESGSMAPFEPDVRASVNQLISQLKGCGENVYFSLYKFSYINATTPIVRTVYRSTPIASVTNLTDAQYNPNGETPLFDATWMAITDMDADVNPATYPPRAGWRKVVIVQTDGIDNRSSRTAGDVGTRINNRESGGGWQIMYMGAWNGGAPTKADLYSQANRMGIQDPRVIAYDTDAANYNIVFQAAARNASNFAAGRRPNINWTNHQRSTLKGFIP